MSKPREKFIVITAAQIDIAVGNLVILCDVEYWNDNYDDLKQWCRDYNAEVRGMTVTMDDQSLTAFCLRW